MESWLLMSWTGNPTWRPVSAFTIYSPLSGLTWSNGSLTWIIRAFPTWDFGSAPILIFKYHGLTGIQYSQEAFHIQGFRSHLQVPLFVGGPQLAGAIPVEFHPVAIGIIQVNGFRHAVVGHPGERVTRIGQSFQDNRQILTGGVQDSRMEQSRGVLRSGRSIFAVPGIQPDMVMVSAGGYEHGAGPI